MAALGHRSALMAMPRNLIPSGVQFVPLLLCWLQTERKGRPKPPTLKESSASFSPFPPRKLSLYVDGWPSWAASAVPGLCHRGLLQVRDARPQRRQGTHHVVFVRGRVRGRLPRRTSTSIPTPSARFAKKSLSAKVSHKFLKNA